MGKNILLVILAGVIIYLLFFVPPVRTGYDLTQRDSLTAALSRSQATVDTLKAKNTSDSLKFSRADSANRAVTAAATRDAQKARTALRQYIAQNPEPVRDSLTEAALASDSVEIYSLHTENAVLRDRVAQQADAYQDMVGQQYTQSKIHAGLLADRDAQIAQLTTDYKQTVKANRRLKAVAIGGAVLGVAGILLAL